MRLIKAGKQLDLKTKVSVLPKRTALPVTVISGFLGSGKTTFLNHLLQSDHDQKIAVMVNDFGSINIDSDLVTQQTDTVISLSNGCICCSVQNDLIGALENVLAGTIGQDIDHILVEASGVSDPAKIAHITRYPNFKDQLSLNMILSLVDVELFKDLDEETRYLALLQIEAADIILINKIDLCTPSDIAAFKANWLFKDARILEIHRGQLDWQLIFEADRETQFRGDQLKKLPDAEQIFDTEQLIIKSPIDLTLFKDAINNLPTSLIRAKGFLYTKEYPDEPILFQLVGRRVEFKKLPKWDEVIYQQTRLVLIGVRGKVDFEEIKGRIEESAGTKVL